MSNLEHAKDCPGSYDESFHTTNVCTCNMEHRLRTEIERLRVWPAAVRICDLSNDDPITDDEISKISLAFLHLALEQADAGSQSARVRFLEKLLSRIKAEKSRADQNVALELFRNRLREIAESDDDETDDELVQYFKGNLKVVPLLRKRAEQAEAALATVRAKCAKVIAAYDKWAANEFCFPPLAEAIDEARIALKDIPNG